MDTEVESELISKFLDYLRVIKKASKDTIESYRFDLCELYDFNTDLLNINEEGVSQYLDYLYSRGLKRNSISRKLSAIRSFYNYLEKEGITKINYFKEVANPKKVASLPKYAKDSDLEKMFASFDKKSPLGQRDSCILEMLYATGVRVGELVNIRLEDINFYDNTIKIFGKGRKERIVIYGSFCEAALNLYISCGRKKLLKENCEYLFLNKNGTRLSERYVRKIIDKVVRNCEVNYHISPHTLRHTFATDMLNAGADLMTIKELLGHSSVNTTGIYTHVTNEQIKSVYALAHPRAKE